MHEVYGTLNCLHDLEWIFVYEPAIKKGKSHAKL